MTKTERIYCAGPMFNPSEINELATISKYLESIGYATFLPPRDGLEIAELFKEIPKARDIVPEEEQGWAKYYLKSAIFAIDVYNILERCDGVVLNLNGRVPDEGGIVEATLAFTAGKPVVFYKTDYRTKLFGEDNLMVTGLARSNSLESPAIVETAIPNEVIEGLYISGLQASLNKNELRRTGITHILSLGSFLDDPHKGEFNHKSFRILDNKSESLSSILPECLEFIQEGRNNGKVLVHCLSGVSRSAAIVTAYLTKSNGMSVDESMQFLKTKRNVVNINEGFQEQLRALT
ncbi:nucleoside 2-deoxyribosyltransferase [Leptospira wolbachii serovar Codice str. CDC]|uniref:Nucleoside 2-deoxyribosyltransferase n=1 Tax=Leptospira wolbachii serovar Codice str. CDC TaxID=1218599 RepID=R9ABJ2_9LEPT|nr:dual specificity protein phosphatase family protein [Leptospira wolbachii]EOQ97560.1 nucleoside 2-deoxyribosyltransferase [Leptospira wolbachii serovar Codice str. CDC]